MKKLSIPLVALTVLVLLSLACGFSAQGNNWSYSYNDQTEPTAPAVETPAAADVPSGGPSVQNPETKVCGMTTAQAKSALGVDVQRLGTESCSWVFRVPGGETTFTAKLPVDWVATITETDGDVKVYTGDENFSITGWAATFRYAPGFPGSDAVNVPCDILAKEQAFGASEKPSFEVSAGNFTCR